MKKIVTTLFFGCLLHLLSAQSSSPEGISNLVPNPGFERFSAPPIGWFYKGDHFTNVMKFWSSPTGASPDVFGPKVHVPQSWAEKGFGVEPPRSGGAMVGITSFGCENGKPHCREYIQVQLVEPLVIGQAYYVEMWVNALEHALFIDQLGFYFSETKINIKTDELLPFTPQVTAGDMIRTSRNKWEAITGTFTAEREGEYLLIGNFFPDSLTQAETHKKSTLQYAYYYIDDITVKKIPPILPVPIKDDDLTKLELEEGKVVRLKDLYFEFDKWELHPRSYVELRKLVKLMNANPDMVIQVNGHTDNWGKSNYNNYLSRKRAKQVVLYLLDQGISPRRTLYKGYGESQPIATNKTPEGRQLNRRVEFLIVKK